MRSVLAPQRRRMKRFTLRLPCSTATISSGAPARGGGAPRLAFNTARRLHTRFSQQVKPNMEDVLFGPRNHNEGAHRRFWSASQAIRNQPPVADCSALARAEVRPRTWEQRTKMAVT